MFSENHKSAGFPIARIGYQWNLQLLTTKSTCPRCSTWSESTAIIACSPAVGVPRLPTRFMGILGCLIEVGKTKKERHWFDHLRHFLMAFSSIPLLWTGTIYLRVLDGAGPFDERLIPKPCQWSQLDLAK